MKTGVIGLGAMGGPMAVNLKKAGLLECAWNRSPGPAQALADENGIPLAEDPAEVARRCDAVIVCVSRDEDVLSVMDAMAEGLHKGLVVVDCSTVSAETAREAARRAAAGGADFLDAPVSGGTEGARQGTLAIMVGGDAGVLQRVQPALDAIGKKTVHMGAHGAGQATKAVNQIIVAGTNQAVTDGLAFGQAAGLDMERVIEVVGSGAAGSWHLNNRGPTMVRGVFDPGFKVALHKKDLGIARAMVEELTDNRLASIERTLADYEKLLEDGHGDEDISSLYRLKKALFKESN
ncbi:MAG: NAD(P)-dependent oxidoreductase [Gammaproteobacteria bacterium]|nr:NAD(P)-dependent oxidoreductase [Gammaproteobacteria bacterium]